ncbi:hypothetical protein [Paenibacillus radicis (ex Gao et al. 2016)]|uniref:Uncharacterized protein n=1 Tax=Paenibacillus radicis (ex Gao et al. 2016) TaxID=1737354 RepID=A0A917H5P8_9BACL|nr:hypothetical protein [Paenibacillus radicis (ex Gao et al. 2016)]GGG68164.1 hypothetical protein GCM10010918_23750 [Paenibacillus radicis (ex Gao et al. 2016)]
MMSNDLGAKAQKPAAILITQVLLYLAAIVNIVNGIYAIGNVEKVKVVLAVVMIVFGAAAAWVAYRLSQPEASSRNYAVALAWILIVLRLIEYSVWHNIGFLLGVILPILVLWRLYKRETKAWYNHS